MGKSTISMAIFNSYVKLPEGRKLHSVRWFPTLTPPSWGRNSFCTARWFRCPWWGAPRKSVSILGSRWGPAQLLVTRRTDHGLRWFNSNINGILIAQYGRIRGIPSSKPTQPLKMDLLVRWSSCKNRDFPWLY
jgi:hypothetical protein